MNVKLKWGGNVISSSFEGRRNLKTDCWNNTIKRSWELGVGSSAYTGTPDPQHPDAAACAETEGSMRIQPISLLASPRSTESLVSQRSYTIVRPFQKHKTIKLRWRSSWRHQMSASGLYTNINRHAHPLCRQMCVFTCTCTHTQTHKHRHMHKSHLDIIFLPL